MPHRRPRALAIVGATATGKTDVSERVAERLNGEIVCADSRQVFRDLEQGTGKPTPEQRAARPHHLYDALALEDRASAGWYRTAADEVATAIIARGRVPILVGGSGLYLRALLQGLAEAPPHHPEIRARLQQEAQAKGVEALHKRLQQADPDTAARVMPRDRQRIVRALEVWETTGQSLSAWHARGNRPGLEADTTVVELTVEPRALGQRIEHRTHQMFEQGLIEETNDLVQRGLREALLHLRAIGYDEALAVLTGELSQPEAEARTTLRTRQLAKRQRTWFRHQIKATSIDATETSVDELVERITQVLFRNGAN